MLGHQQLIDSALTKQHHLVCKHCQVWGGWADSTSYRNKHIILYFDFHKSEQFWNISAFYRGQKESQNWYEVNKLGHFDICTGMWLLRGHRIVRDQVWCYQHFQILLPFVRPLLYSECSIITIIDIGMELYFRFLSVRPCHSSNAIFSDSEKTLFTRPMSLNLSVTYVRQIAR